MRPASQLFFLATFAFLRSGYGMLRAATKLKSVSPDTCAINPDAIVSDACTSYAALESLNTDVAPLLQEVTQNTDFFAYYRLNLFNKECPFWSDAISMCGNRACAVDTIEDERDIPPIWRAEELSKLEGAKAKHPGKALQKERPKARPLQYQLGEDVDESCVLEDDDECDERDFCVPEDEGATSKGDYVSLVNNTERFTGYSGPGPHQIWDAIYKENCFTKSHPSAASPSSPPGVLSAVKDFASIIQEYGRQNVGLDPDDLYPLDDECLEQRAFYRIISGMHASISTHICWDYFNQTTGEWVRNLQCYKERLHKHPDHVSNLYFNYALVTRALTKLRKHLNSYTFCSGDPLQDFETKQKVLELIDRVAAAPHTFDESVMFRDPGMMELKDDFKLRFRNVSRLMDCVGCDKCRLWGKVQTAGYGAALKVLFEFDELKNGENPHLRRTELVALVNTLGRISHSLTAIQHFRKMMPGDPLDNFEASGVTDLNMDDENDYSPYEVVDLHDFGDLDDDPYAPVTTPTTIYGEFWSEFDLVWNAYKHVLSTWVGVPITVGSIFAAELNRLWNFWLGLPVPGRSWNFRAQGRDEL